MSGRRCSTRRRRLREPGVPEARRPGAPVRVRAARTRLPDRLVLGRPPSPPADHGDAVLGRRRDVRRGRSVRGERVTALSCSPASPSVFDLPFLGDPHWDPLWSTAYRRPACPSASTSAAATANGFLAERIEAHGSARVRPDVGDPLPQQRRADRDLLMSGVLPRFPQLRFVSVEPGSACCRSSSRPPDYRFEAAGLQDLP